MRYYPMFIDLQGKRCLIVGAGAVGLRKLEALLPCQPEEVLVLDTAAPSEDIRQYTKSASDRPAVVRFEQRAFTPADMHGRALAFACTGNRKSNEAVADAAKEHAVLCNIVDAPATGDFIVPAHFESGDILVALSTGGHSPALARRIRQELQAQFGQRYAALAALMGRLRPLVLAQNNETRQNTALFRELVNSTLIDALEAGDIIQARTILQDILPAPLHQNIGELLDEHA